MPSLTQGINLDGLPKLFDAVVWLIAEDGWDRYHKRPMQMIGLNDTNLGEQHLLRIERAMTERGVLKGRTRLMLLQLQLVRTV